MWYSWPTGGDADGGVDQEGEFSSIAQCFGEARQGIRPANNHHAADDVKGRR